VIQVLCWSAGVLAACALFRRHRPGPAACLRFLTGWVLGAVAAHAGWALLHADVARPTHAWRPAGFTVLGVPLGPLAASLGAGPAYRAAALATLPAENTGPHSMLNSNA